MSIRYSGLKNMGESRSVIETCVSAAVATCRSGFGYRLAACNSSLRSTSKPSSRGCRRCRPPVAACGRSRRRSTRTGIGRVAARLGDSSTFRRRSAPLLSPRPHSGPCASITVRRFRWPPLPRRTRRRRAASISCTTPPSLDVVRPDHVRRRIRVPGPSAATSYPGPSAARGRRCRTSIRNTALAIVTAAPSNFYRKTHRCGRLFDRRYGFGRSACEAHFRRRATRSDKQRCMAPPRNGKYHLVA